MIGDLAAGGNFCPTEREDWKGDLWVIDDSGFAEIHGVSLKIKVGARLYSFSEVNGKYSDRAPSCPTNYILQ